MSVELRDQLIRQTADLPAPRNAAPGRIHPIQNIFARRFALEQPERLRPRPAGAAAEIAKALRLMHGPALAGNALNGSPETGSLPSISIRTIPAFSVESAAPRPGPPFMKMRLGCHGVRSRSCSGKAFGSPASLNASTASTAEAV